MNSPPYSRRRAHGNRESPGGKVASFENGRSGRREKLLFEPKALVERLNNSHVYICSQDDAYWIAAAFLNAGFFVPQPMPRAGVGSSCPRRSRNDGWARQTK
jgi:hypothetical protein